MEDLLDYLEKEEGVHKQAVERPLSELAAILGYRVADTKARIGTSDTEILLEEIGSDAASARAVLRFIRQQQQARRRALRDRDAAASTAAEEWGRIQNAKDLHLFARKESAEVDNVHPNFISVTTSGGAVLHFKLVGRRDTTRGRDGYSERRPLTDKQTSVRLCSPAETAGLFDHPLAGVVADDEMQDVDELDSDDEAHPRNKKRMRGLDKEVPSNRMRRESVGRCSGPRRRSRAPQWLEEE